ncbi:RNA polymerase II transcription factor SIII subunit A-domain-containing protein [Annulohypoxylon maeteangense]|uniref:RNA polymerase II transcription factor SIII subunit A-domain-containing protein n=1 Tax=Annulohypoxylon maeteangense TaxID=1927788 RepID=UPI002008BC45|nr:RNA polymerase II transcription factor SIII subunit A-domain-containing protein [Annulohypoxylon maeteangense]KAI0890708.1 RNA polymerase II transcription factor SIII subunit A-domain-containing protein [Annulohypoxylon maeteangense]
MVKSLVDLCRQVCIQNIKDIYDVGDLPYSALAPILLKINDYEHLLQLEQQSPQIQGDNAECWKRLIRRDFPQQVKKHTLEPKDPTRWCKIYQKYKILDAEEKKAAVAKLNNGFKNISKEKQAKAVKAVTFNTRVHGRIPGQRKTGLPAGRHVVGSGGLTWGGGSRTKTSSAHGIMQKARREAAEIARRKQLSTPTGQLLVRQGQITQAPRGMVEEHRIKSLPSVAMRRSQIQAPMRGNGERWERQQQEREARLLKAKSGPVAKGVTVLSDDDLPQDDEEDYSDSEQEEGGLNVEDLESFFDEKKTSTPTPAPVKSSSAAKSSSTLSGLAKMKMGHAWKDRPTRIERVVETSKASSLSAPKSSTATSPPPRSSTFPDQLSPPPKPKLPMGLKRKAAPSVFMPPKQKARRMS